MRGEEINLLISEFRIALRNKFTEEPAAFNRGAAAAGFKKLLAAYPRHDIQPRFNQWFASTDAYIERRGWRVEDFFAHFNRLKDGPIVARSYERREKTEDEKRTEFQTEMTKARERNERIKAAVDAGRRNTRG